MVLIAFGLSVTDNVFGTKPDNSNDNVTQKVFWICYIADCALILIINVYVINMFYRMANYYLKALMKNYEINARKYKTFFIILMLIIYITMIKTYLFDLTE